MLILAGESPSRRLISADFSHASADAPSIPALGCRAGLVVAVMGVANMNYVDTQALTQGSNGTRQKRRVP